MREIHKLNVEYNGQLVGVMAEDATGKIAFQYDSD